MERRRPDRVRAPITRVTGQPHCPPAQALAWCQVIERTAAGELNDHEAAGLSTVCGLRSQALFALYTRFSLARGVGRANNAPILAAGREASVGQSENTPSGRTRLCGLRHSSRGEGVPAQQPGSAASLIRPATLRRHGHLGYTELRTDATGSLAASVVAGELSGHPVAVAPAESGSGRHVGHRRKARRSGGCERRQ